MFGLGDTFDKNFLKRLPHLAGPLSLKPNVAALIEAWQDWPTLNDLALVSLVAGVKTATNHNLCFVEAGPTRRQRHRGPKPLGPTYERRIYETGEVPTRLANWHDFLNALAWFLFPQIKAALNKRQVEGGDPNVVRTREQNRLAMFDEGGVILYGTQVFIVGHALMESLLLGQCSVRAMAFEIQATLEFADSVVARAIEAGAFQRLEPFPVYDLEQGVVYAGRSARCES